MRNIFCKKNHTQNVDVETVPRPISKKSKLSISVDQWCKVLYSLFLLYANLKTTEI